MTAPSTLAGKLVAVMAAAGTIPKNGVHELGYRYATDGDVAHAIREQLVTNRVALLVGSRITNVRLGGQTSSGKQVILTDVDVDLTFIDADTGERETIGSCATSSGTADEGTAKAVTGAVKQALLKTFLVSADDSTPTPAATGQPTRATTTPAADGSDDWTWPFGKEKGTPYRAVSTSSLKWFADKYEVKAGPYEERDLGRKRDVAAELEKRGELATTLKNAAAT